MKKFLFGLTLGVILSITSVTFATESNKIEALIFKARYLFNGSEKDLTLDYKTLNIDGNTYVPTRFIVENMGSAIDYDASSQTISINYSPMGAIKSEVNSSVEDDNFMLSLYSGKKLFKQTDYFDIWSTLRYKGQSGINLTHNYNIISFYIIDEKGNKAELGNPYMTKKSDINKGDEFRRIFSSWLIQNYNIFFSNQGNLMESASRTLPPGKYKIGITASYLKNSDTYDKTGDYDSEETTLSTEIPIAIE
ncbi:copper amine oxidase N-terminal domain-containing protein [Paenibacillus sp. H1-7]|uniref:stalk domain-containing protein n=1 Tax=Paenibacillus sp. H1-7 TaxID=2282849 RepID=UPI001EF79699|nr:stalk domain-containing protein [Paenibacillus sp. H1-7]ULL14762.1 copper amine oxidase N-terminal domain-containing protein [Paenibacillus sp. H1-7]